MKFLLISILGIFFASNVLAQNEEVNSTTNPGDLESKIVKMQDSLRRLQEAKLIDEYKLDLGKKNTGKIIQETFLRKSPDQNSGVSEKIPAGTQVDVFSFLPEKSCWAVRYEGKLGFVGVESIMIVKSGKMKASKYDVKPKLVKYFKPAYPKEAIKKGIEGKVIVKVYIDKHGNVGDAVIYKGIPELNQAAKKTAMKYKFKPAKYKGKPVGVWVPLGINFKL